MSDVQESDAVVVEGNLENYAQLDFFVGDKLLNPIISIFFCVQDDGYAGCCIEFQHVMVCPRALEAMKTSEDKRLQAFLFSSNSSYGGRGSHPAGPYGKNIQDAFIQSIYAVFIERVVEALVPVFRTAMVARLRTSGQNAVEKIYKNEWQPKVVAVSA